MSDIEQRDIEALIETFEASDWSEMTLKIDGLELFLSKTPGARPAVAETSASAVPRPDPGLPSGGAAALPQTLETTRSFTAPKHWVAVRAPNLGTFYRAPKPGAPAYVKVGQPVDPSTELCLIEVMKLFTSVLAGVSGTVREVLVEDAELVEFDQALFLIEPDA
jgi:acetyl-CoA carboxylase biotin carboxyl carrier protein